MEHNSRVQHTTEAVVNPVESASICILLQNGNLFGPFRSREDAMYWAIGQDMEGYSTYDLRAPWTPLS